MVRVHPTRGNTWHGAVMLLAQGGSMNAVRPQECTGEVTMRRVSGDEGLEGVSDSDVHGWTVPRYGAAAKESGGAGVANLATVLHEAGERKTERNRDR